MIDLSSKLAKITTAITLTVAIVFGSGLAEAVAEGKLLVWINGDKGYQGLQKVGDKFTQDTGVQVIVEHPDDALSKFQQSTAKGKGPDIWIWAHDRLGEWVDEGLLSPISPSNKIKESFEEKGWDAFTMKGKIWGYPITFETIGLIYNKQLVPNPPRTFEEIPALDKTLSKQGKNAILWDYNNTYLTWPLLAANGGYAFAKKKNGDYDAGDVGVNNEGAVRGALMVASLLKEGVMPRGASYLETDSKVNSGEVAMMINGPWAWSNLKKSGIDFGVAPIPSIDGNPGKPFVGVLGAMISRTSPNKELAIEFLEGYMLQVDGLKEIDKDVPLGAVANKAYFKELSVNEHIAATMDNVILGEPMPNIPDMADFWSAMAAALENITQDRQTPKEALDHAYARITNK